MKKNVINKGENVSVVVKANEAENCSYLIMEGGHLEFVYLGIEANAKNVQLIFDLEGVDAGLDFFGFILGHYQDEFKIKGVSRCLNRKGKTRFDIRSALFDKSKVNFEGEMLIDSDGHESECYLSHKTLLLSDKARTKTVPALEIRANDVKAGHAATLGRLDAQDLFYLKSRGINEQTATQMILKGFYEDLLKEIQDDKVRKVATELLFKNL